MSALHSSGILGGASILCRVWAMLRGDLMFAGDFTACLMGGFILFALGSLVSLAVGVIRRALTHHRAKPN
jgi:hypothetical protein